MVSKDDWLKKISNFKDLHSLLKTKLDINIGLDIPERPTSPH